ncbi:Protein INX-3 [Aphelenchoides avenae]|nr:Protein INX-3 [Aphelenchus avenae]
MFEIPFLNEFLSKLKSAGLDDVVDRLNYCFTSILLVLCATVVGTKQIFGHPIACMVDAEFPGQWVDYVHDYCFTKTTYYYRPSQDPAVPGLKSEVAYYQWAPYVLALQALMFYFPHFLWTSLEKSSDLDLRSTVEQVLNTRSLANEQRRLGVQTVVEYLADWSSAVVVAHEAWDAGAPSRTSCPKMLSVANLFLQIYLLHRVVGHGHSSWALTIIQGAIDGNYWPETGLFPRVTYCDFEMFTLGNVQKKTAQCALMINMLNEKVFVLVYAWLVFLLLPTVLNLVYSVAIVAGPFLRLWFVKRYMEPLRTLSYTPTLKFGHYEANRRLKTFVFQVLGMDGFLLLRFVQAHAGHLVASEVARGLFKQWEEQQTQPLGHVNHGIDNFTARSEFDEAEQYFLGQNDGGCSTA